MQFALRVNSAKHGVKCKSFQKLRKYVRSSFEGNAYVCPEYGKVDSCSAENNRRLQKIIKNHGGVEKHRKAEKTDMSRLLGIVVDSLEKYRVWENR